MVQSCRERHCHDLPVWNPTCAKQLFCWLVRLCSLSVGIFLCILRNRACSFLAPLQNQVCVSFRPLQGQFSRQNFGLIFSRSMELTRRISVMANHWAALAAIICNRVKHDLDDETLTNLTICLFVVIQGLKWQFAVFCYLHQKFQRYSET